MVEASSPLVAVSPTDQIERLTRSFVKTEIERITKKLENKTLYIQKHHMGIIMMFFKKKKKTNNRRCYQFIVNKTIISSEKVDFCQITNIKHGPAHAEYESVYQGKVNFCSTFNSIFVESHILILFLIYNRNSVYFY